MLGELLSVSINARPPQGRWVQLQNIVAPVAGTVGLASAPVSKERGREGAKTLPHLRLLSKAPASAPVLKEHMREGAEMLQL